MIAILKKSGVALLVLALALIAQIPHAAHVFDRAPYIGQAVQIDSAWYALLLAYAYAIALESATLMFVVHGHRRASYGFAIASFSVNLSYYAMHGVNLWTWAAFPAWLLSALLPIAIASYSHILTGSDDVQVGWPAWALSIVDKYRNQTQTITQLPTVEDATPIKETQPAIVAEEFQTQLLDEMNATIIDAIRDGACTPYAISKQTGITVTTLKRTDKATGKVSGRLSKLCDMGLIHNSSGADGSEYRLTN